MPRPDIAAITARAQAATEGPWKWVCTGALCTVEHGTYTRCDYLDKDWFHLDSPKGEVVGHWSQYADDAGMSVNDEDAVFIAHARQDIPDLLRYIAELEAAGRHALRNCVCCNSTGIDIVADGSNLPSPCVTCTLLHETLCAK